MRRFSTFAVAALAGVTTASAAACSETPAMTASGSTPSAPVAAQPSAQDAVGLWRLSTPDDARGCLLALNLDAAAGGYGVVLEDCRRPDLAKARSWRLTRDGLDLHDARGGVVLSLHRRNVDAYEGRNESAAYRMERAPLV